ncbi:MAG: hypothetical protein UT48_C0014G0015 [Parcubacteria group bacterium GW2011_GWE2_39_37]|nr:MAG: hypothetical protein UT48_C0014G0015 [Parcubacteria group bacterium GW2011_GWE2_39_37]
MLKEKAIKIINNLTEIIILGTIFLIPLFFNIYTYSTFEIDKIVLFRILVELAFGFFLIKTFLVGEIFIKKSSLFFVLSLIFLTQIISFLFSEHRAVAFWGTYARSFGLFTYIHLYVFAFLMFDYVNKNEKNLGRIIITSTIVGLTVSLYGILQFFGLDFLKWQGIAAGSTMRASSTLGQPNILASLILLLLPLSVYALITAGSFLKKFIYLLVIMSEVACLFATLSRAAWLGMIFSSIIFLLVLFYKKNRLVFNISILAAAIITGAFLYFSFVRPVQVNADSGLNLSSRIRSLANVYQGSSMIRLYYYDAAANLIRLSPWIGYGLDTQQYHFFKFYRPDYAIFETINSYNDRAHSEPLDIMITGGLLGISAWLFLFFKIIKGSKLLIKSNLQEEKRLLLCLLFGLVAFSFSLLFGFFTIALSVYFWLYVALLFALFTKDNGTKNIKLELSPIITRSFLILWVIFSIFLVWNYNLKITLASYYYRNALEADNKKEYVSSFNHLNKALAYQPGESFYHSQFAAHVLSSSAGSAATLEFVKKLLENSTKPIPEARMNLAVVLTNIVRLNISIGKEPKVEAEKAETILKNLIKEAPGFSHLYFDWGNLYFFQHKYDQALDKYYQALASYPALDRPELNNEHRQQLVREIIYVYARIIDVKIAQKKYQQAENLCLRALEIDPGEAEIRQKLKWLEEINLK